MGEKGKYGEFMQWCEKSGNVFDLTYEEWLIAHIKESRDSNNRSK